jgi:hypothetical protein
MLDELPSNVQFTSNHTVNILNLYYYDEFEEWYKQLMQSEKFIKFTFNPCNGILSPQEVPKKLFNMIIKKYGVDSKITRTVTNSDCQDQTALSDYLTKLDARRGLDWRQVFPEISDCFV